jgi:hypothetical protein
MLNFATMRRFGFAIAVALFLTTMRVDGHHHIGCVYDTRATQTVTGRIMEVVWKMPHVYIHLDVAGGSTGSSEWDIETQMPRALQQQGIDLDTLKVGDVLVTDAWVAKNGGRQAFTQSMTLQNGKTVTFPIAELGCPF